MNPLTCDWHDLGPYAPMVFGTTPGMRFDVFGTSAQVLSDPLRGTRFFKVEVGYPRHDSPPQLLTSESRAIREDLPKWQVTRQEYIPEAA